ncbi:MAG: hypothetical protein PWP23_2864 [Candidatus Sumerlaeota bacterium]|nr:hypothetical protein [Candidatus Sumerlaeota bacterium]
MGPAIPAIVRPTPCLSTRLANGVLLAVFSGCYPAGVPCLLHCNALCDKKARCLSSPMERPKSSSGSRNPQKPRHFSGGVFSRCTGCALDHPPCLTTIMQQLFLSNNWNPFPPENSLHQVLDRDRGHQKSAPARFQMALKVFRALCSRIPLRQVRPLDRRPQGVRPQTIRGEDAESTCRGYRRVGTGERRTAGGAYGARTLPFRWKGLA